MQLEQGGADGVQLLDARAAGGADPAELGGARQRELMRQVALAVALLGRLHLVERRRVDRVLVDVALDAALHAQLEDDLLRCLHVVSQLQWFIRRPFFDCKLSLRKHSYLVLSVPFFTPSLFNFQHHSMLLFCPSF